MNDDETKKTFDHGKASIADKLLLAGELEHGLMAIVVPIFFFATLPVFL